ncbi:MAG: DUF4254 domain-containing protein [Candidatus Omnitrophica bacterium]|nr:DUF4254 domain-containing protein [Candidatus Omnitrophota bacterium]
MAETLGSLMDKLSIKSIREFYLKKMIRLKNNNFSAEQLQEKLRVLQVQKKNLVREIDFFFAAVARGELVIRDEKLKLYNNPRLMNRIGAIDTLARGFDALTKKNLELWQLEDEARRADVPLSFIGSIKRKIDAANQQRNDLIDRIDELLERSLRK